jgi:hypothetical protein
MVLDPLIDTTDTRVKKPDAAAEKLGVPAAVTVKLYVPSVVLVAETVPIVMVASETTAPVTILVTVPVNVDVVVALGAVGELPPPLPPPHATASRPLLSTRILTARCIS